MRLNKYNVSMTFDLWYFKTDVPNFFIFLPKVTLISISNLPMFQNWDQNSSWLILKLHKFVEVHARAIICIVF